MSGLRLNRKFQVPKPRFFCLVGHTVNQIQPHVFKPGLFGPGYSNAGIAAGMDTPKKMKIHGIKRLNPDVYSIDAGTQICLELFQTNGAGIYFQSNFSMGKDFIGLTGGLNDFSNCFCIQNRWCAATHIKGVKC